MKVHPDLQSLGEKVRVSSDGPLSLEKFLSPSRGSYRPPELGKLVLCQGLGIWSKNYRQYSFNHRNSPLFWIGYKCIRLSCPDWLPSLQTWLQSYSVCDTFHISIWYSAEQYTSHSLPNNVFVFQCYFEIIAEILSRNYFCTKVWQTCSYCCLTS